jgi:hypothetical protein
MIKLQDDKIQEGKDSGRKSFSMTASGKIQNDKSFKKDPGR